LNDYINLVLDAGAHRAAQILTQQLRFSEEFYAACKQDYCGRFGRSYTCPPHVGEIGDLIARVKKYKTAIIFQTIHDLKDSRDFEGMRRGQDLHNEITFQVAKKTKDGLVLNAGGCFLCETCGAVSGEPCRFPGLAISSLEAHGIDVASIERVSALKFMNGLNTVTFFSGLFLDAS
jgi:predicted metal-binding protein